MLQGTLMERSISHSTQLFDDGRNARYSLAASTLSLRLLGDFELRANEMPVRRPDMPHCYQIHTGKTEKKGQAREPADTHRNTT
jgi:hypothetical protein